MVQGYGLRPHPEDFCQPSGMEAYNVIPDNNPARRLEGLMMTVIANQEWARIGRRRI